MAARVELREISNEEGDVLPAGVDRLGRDVL